MSLASLLTSPFICEQCKTTFERFSDYTGHRCYPAYDGPTMPFVHDDGGRAAAGYKGMTSDCVTRSIAIAAEMDYQSVYDALNAEASRERPRGRKKRSTARTGVHKATIRRYLDSLGWSWVPTMQIGSGATVHLRPGELPAGRLVVSVSKHLCAVIDGVIHDTSDPSREGMRCVYGYWVRGV